MRPVRSPQHAALGRAVRELREQKGVSQEQLATLSSLHRNYVGGIERGELNISLAVIVKIADGLGVSLGALFTRADTLEE